MQRTKLSKLIIAIVSISVALMAFAILGLVGYKLVGAGGAVGIAILIIGLAVNAYFIKVEDMPDEHEKPGSSKHK